jgi:phosphoribosylglycinamide formyltransferase 1
MIQLAILASGNGSNAKKIIEFFKDHEAIRVALVISNNPSAGVLSIANNHEIPTAIFNKKTIDEQEFVRATLVSFGIDFIVLAGFMIKLPSYFSLLFPKRMLNIHPALLPKYGGKGMFGIHVHEAVFQHKEKETGITIHFVNEKYDEGKIVFQKKINIENCKNPQEIAHEVLKIEHEYYAKVIERVILKA